MKDLLPLIAHLLTTIAQHPGLGGAKTIVADNLLIKPTVYHRVRVDPVASLKGQPAARNSPFHGFRRTSGMQQNRSFSARY